MTSHDPELERFARLLKVFVDVVSSRRDLNLRGSAAPPDPGFAVRLQPGPRSRGVELALRPSEARLSMWSDDGDGDPDGDDRVLQLDLRQGYRWACVDFPDAATLTVALVRRMEDEVNLSPSQSPLRL